jgi:regulator of cell morphogenesis and NO signaling
MPFIGPPPLDPRRRPSATAWERLGQTEMAGLESLESTEAVAAPDDPADLISHIVARHHAYVRGAIPVIQHRLAEVAAAEGERHPELRQLVVDFNELSHELTRHLAEEEQVLFPLIVRLAEVIRSGGQLPADASGVGRNQISMMAVEHQHLDDALVRIRKLSSAYTPPPDASEAHRRVYDELRTFDSDMRRHSHLEENVLFPRVVIGLMELGLLQPKRG